MPHFNRPVIKSKCQVCGRIFWAERSKVLSGKRKCCSMSCRGTTARNAQPKHQGRPKLHGGSSTRLYRIWACIKRRCHSPTFTSYGAYGANGIRMCPQWRKSFQSFKDWAIRAGYSDALQCDRIDNDFGYSPRNCRWVTPAQNSANRRNSVILPTGETTSQAAKRLGVSPKTILNRLKHLPLTPMQCAMLKKLVGGEVKRSFYLRRLGKWKD